ncbi:MAG: hypothetical protein KGQ66_17510 [Acidobacteriota bacterium]|nr:hypothetical protein [Acidobacteriota bacterium]
MSYRERGEHRVLRVVGSSTGLIIIALLIGLVIASALGGLAWALAGMLHHAANQ